MKRRLFPEIHVSTSALSHRERVLLALSHETTDRVPISMVCSGVNEPERFDRWLRETRGIGMEEYFAPVLDIAQVRPPYIGPALGEGEDCWSVVRSPVSYGAGTYDEIVRYPLADAATTDDLRGFRWPSTDWFDYNALPGLIRETGADGGERCIMVKGGNPFETAWYMRGFERAFVDLVENPELIGFIMERVTDFWTAHTRKVLESARGMVDLIFTADDIGHQQGLLLSLPMWREHIMPHHARLNAVVHEYGARVIYHTDGAVMEAVPGLAEMGIDVLQALQFDAAGMDPVVLKDRYGDRLSFEGGVSVQSTLPFGTADDVREEVRSRIAVLGRGGGYILGPSHAIQAGTPPENIAALFDTALSTPLS